MEVRGELIFLFVGAAIAFGAGIWYFLGEEKGAEFFAGYILEQSLSVDNLFVFILVFKYFKTPRADQDKVPSPLSQMFFTSRFSSASPVQDTARYTRMHD